MTFSKANVAAIGLALAGVAAQIGSLPNWHAATAPAFVAGVIAVLGGVIGGTFTAPPAKSTPAVNTSASASSKLP